MTLLSRVQSPRDLDRLTAEQLEELASEIRSFLIKSVSQTGGHLGPNLGAVELTIALHRVFESPRDRILFDGGHQSYVHKLLTGRQEFSKMFSKSGLSGYQSPAESEHDVFENTHMSVSLGWADGLAKSHQLLGENDRHVVTVIGDGALTGGMAWEALNNIAAAQDRPAVIVLNDNGRSYAPTVGGLANHLASLRTAQPGHETPHRRPGQPSAGPTWFENLGLAYIGPVDGHDIMTLESALRRAKRLGSPVVVHCVTQKGRGYKWAEQHEVDRFHFVSPIHTDTGAPVGPVGGDWSSVFRDEMMKIGADRKDVVAVTAAMLEAVGLDGFAEAYPERTFDVGIAEQHAAVSAAGLAAGGMHPVVAAYSTFLNRAFDQVLMDVGLQKCGVTFVLDRAGITGSDGASFNGMWDMSIFQIVPGLRLAAPRDADQVRRQLREAIDVADAPTVVRFPNGTDGPGIPALAQVGGMDVLSRADASRPDVLIVSIGGFAPMCLEIAELLKGEGIHSTVVDPRWVQPVDEALPGLAAQHRVVVTVEDNVRVGGVGSAVAQALRDAGVDVPLRDFGIPKAFLGHASREEVLADIGLTASAIARRVGDLVSRLS